MSSLRPIPADPGPAEDALDRDALGRLAAGDLEALQGLYDRHSTMAYSIALRITADPAAAEDAVQEAFLGVWRSAERYADERGSIRTWLLSIVRHRAIDLVRRRRQVAGLLESDGPLPAAMVLPDAWSEVSGRLDRDAIEAALQGIPAVQRQAIELAYFGGLTQLEIATRTGAPLGTVKGRLRLGLLALRDALAGPRATLTHPDGGRGGDDG
jgi:RNA polymerase sigma-70 factor (ECF subfamily)